MASLMHRAAVCTALDGPDSVATRANPKRIWAKHDDAEVVPLVCRIGNQKRIKVQWLIWGLG